MSCRRLASRHEPFYFRRNDDYKNPNFGFQLAKYDTFTGEIDYSPNDRWNVNVFYTYEKNRDNQKGAINLTNALEYWTSTVDDKTNSVGGSATFQIVPDKWTFTLFGRYQKLDGFNAIFSPAGNSAQVARATEGGVTSIPEYDDTKLLTFNAELQYGFAKAWTLALGGWYEDYNFADAFTQASSYFPVTGAFLMLPNNGNYTARVVYTRLDYRF